MLANSGVTRLVATQFKRTQETLAPLADKLLLPVEVKLADRTRDLISELRGSPDGSIVVIATHSNVVPLIVRELAATKLRGVEGDALSEEEFSHVVILTQPCGAPKPFVMELSSDAL